MYKFVIDHYLKNGTFIRQSIFYGLTGDDAKHKYICKYDYNENRGHVLEITQVVT